MWRLMQKKTRCEVIINDLKKYVRGGYTKLERETVGQYTNKFWTEKRMNRPTASKFGVVVKRLPYTPCHNLVKSI